MFTLRPFGRTIGRVRDLGSGPIASERLSTPFKDCGGPYLLYALENSSSATWLTDRVQLLCLKRSVPFVYVLFNCYRSWLSFWSSGIVNCRGQVGGLVAILILCLLHCSCNSRSTLKGQCFSPKQINALVSK